MGAGEEKVGCLVTVVNEKGGWVFRAVKERCDV